ncbi:MAG: AAA family ATPase [Anaerolineae bacterium]|nr:AAA family ATPase [Anaerolineae bacterium]MCO5191805.1 AAA family ATPase [Anaerolineae bacterium]MCO5207452.1 AAA family ATPase [Anaerolineae bacterium]
MSKIIAIAMQKGGVGKTTTTVNLAAALAECGQRVLAVDLDAQGNLTQHVGLDPEKLTPTVYDAFRDEIDGYESVAEEAIRQTSEAFDLLPSQPELSLVEIGLMNVISREKVLSIILQPIREHYDYILIDCNPSLGLLVVNALAAADSVLIPVQTEYLAARGANMILATIDTVRRKQLNPNLYIEGILLTMVDTRTILMREVMEAVKEQLGEQNVFDVVIKRSIRFAESVVAGKSILAYDSSSQGAEAYRTLAKEIMGNG